MGGLGMRELLVILLVVLVVFGAKKLRTVGSRSEEHTSELQSQSNLVCRLLLEKKNDDHSGPDAPPPGAAPTPAPNPAHSGRKACCSWTSCAPPARQPHVPSSRSVSHALPPTAV